MYFKERNGYFNVFQMLSDIETDFINSSFNIIKSARDIYINEDKTYSKADPLVLIVEPTILTDLASAETPWVIVFKAYPTPFRYDAQSTAVEYDGMYSGTNNGGSIEVNICTPRQIIDIDKGEIATDDEFPGSTSGSLNDTYSAVSSWKAGSGNTYWKTDTPSSNYSMNKVTLPFIEWFMSEEVNGMNHTKTHRRSEHAHPMAAPSSYSLAITNHSVFFTHWKETDVNKNSNHSWFAVQRPVNENGNVMDIGKKPVFCTYCHASRAYQKTDSVSNGNITHEQLAEYQETIGNPDTTYLERIAAMGKLDAVEGVSANYLLNKFVVCEADVNTPAKPVPALQDTPDSSSIINGSKQVAITESSRYSIAFPSLLNTQRFVYADQFDSFGVTSADVIGQDVDIDLEVFGGIKRYRGIHTNLARSQGMRIMMLVHEQFEQDFDETVVDNLAEGDLMDGGGNVPALNPFGKAPRSQSELGINFENSNIAIFDPSAVYE